MIWPFKRTPETRSAAPYSDAILSALVAAASGRTGADPAATSALEAAAGLVGRVLSTATVDGPSTVRSALSGDLLQLAGREMLRRGQSLFVIDVTGDGLALTPAATWDVRGGHDPATWAFRVDRAGPSNIDSRVVPWSRVLLFKWASDPWRPWAGVSPLGAASLTARVLAETESALGDEVSGPRGTLIATPPFETDPDDDVDPTAMLRQTIETLGGKTAILEAGSWGRDQEDRPRQDYMPRRLGADPLGRKWPRFAGPTRPLRDLVRMPAFHPHLSIHVATAPWLRESLRRFFSTTIVPLALKIEREASAKLGAGISLVFDKAAFQDTVGRANIVAKLAAVEGISPDLAMALAGLDET